MKIALSQILAVLIFSAMEQFYSKTPSEAMLSSGIYFCIGIFIGGVFIELTKKGDI